MRSSKDDGNSSVVAMIDRVDHSSMTTATGTDPNFNSTTCSSQNSALQGMAFQANIVMDDHIIENDSQRNGSNSILNHNNVENIDFRGAQKNYPHVLTQEEPLSQESLVSSGKNQALEVVINSSSGTTTLGGSSTIQTRENHNELTIRQEAEDSVHNSSSPSLDKESQAAIALSVLFTGTNCTATGSTSTSTSTSTASQEQQRQSSPILLPTSGMTTPTPTSGTNSGIVTVPSSQDSTFNLETIMQSDDNARDHDDDDSVPKKVGGVLSNQEEKKKDKEKNVPFSASIGMPLHSSSSSPHSAALFSIKRKLVQDDNDADRERHEKENDHDRVISTTTTMKQSSFSRSAKRIKEEGEAMELKLHEENRSSNSSPQKNRSQVSIDDDDDATTNSVNLETNETLASPTMIRVQPQLAKTTPATDQTAAKTTASQLTAPPTLPTNETLWSQQQASTLPPPPHAFYHHHQQQQQPFSSHLHLGHSITPSSNTKLSSNNQHTTNSSSTATPTSQSALYTPMSTSAIPKRDDLAVVTASTTATIGGSSSKGKTIGGINTTPSATNTTMTTPSSQQLQRRVGPSSSSSPPFMSHHTNSHLNTMMGMNPNSEKNNKHSDVVPGFYPNSIPAYMAPPPLASTTSSSRLVTTPSPSVNQRGQSPQQQSNVNISSKVSPPTTNPNVYRTPAKGTRKNPTVPPNPNTKTPSGLHTSSTSPINSITPSPPSSSSSLLSSTTTTTTTPTGKFGSLKHSHNNLNVPFNNTKNNGMPSNPTTTTTTTTTTIKTATTNYNRKEKSLGVLCEKFMREYINNHESTTTIPTTATNNNNNDISSLPFQTLSIDAAAKSLKVERRRIYDIINILEAIRVVAKKCKNTYYIYGTGGLQDTFQSMQMEAIEMWRDDAIENGLLVEGGRVVVATGGGDNNDGNTNEETQALDLHCPEVVPPPQSGLAMLLASAEHVEDNLQNSEKYFPIKPYPISPPNTKQQQQQQQQANIIMNSKRLPSPTSKKSTKEKSLGKLSQKFIQLFLVGHEVIALTDASDKILGPNPSTASSSTTTTSKKEGSTKPTKLTKEEERKERAKESRGLKTKIRRLYDIANVLVSVGLIEKLNGGNNMSNVLKHRPSFKWIYGMSAKALMDKSNRNVMPKNGTIPPGYVRSFDNKQNIPTIYTGSSVDGQRCNASTNEDFHHVSDR